MPASVKLQICAFGTVIEKADHNFARTKVMKINNGFIKTDPNSVCFFLVHSVATGQYTRVSQTFHAHSADIQTWTL